MSCCKCAPKDKPKEVICLTDPSAGCAEIRTKNSTNKALDAITCDPPTELSETGACRPVTAGGSAICQSGPTLAAIYSPTPLEPKKELVTVIKPPALNVPIPGLQFKSSIPIYSDSPKAEIPFLAQYLSAVYNYLLGIVLITAAVMIIYGGFKYVLSSSLRGIKDGKEIIKDAIIGLILVFAVVTMLQTVNPSLTGLKPISLLVVRQIPFEQQKKEAFEGAKGEFIELTDEDKKSMSAPYTALTLKPASACGSKLLNQEIRDAAMRTQQATGVPAAIILAQYGLESGFGKSCIGKPDKKYNCFGIKCVSNGKYEGNEKLVADGVHPTCPSNCTEANTLEPSKKTGKLEPFWACFQDYPDFAASLTSHSGVVKKSGWQQYNGSAVGFAHFVENRRYAIPGYSKVLIQIMKDQCLL